MSDDDRISRGRAAKATAIVMLAEQRETTATDLEGFTGEEIVEFCADAFLRKAASAETWALAVLLKRAREARYLEWLARHEPPPDPFAAYRSAIPGAR